MTSSTLIMAANMSNLLIGIELRYHGMSQPHEDWETENMVQLTTEQAAADIAYIILGLQDEFNAKYGYSDTRKWWISGCSFAANTAVWVHMKYPHVFDACFADSAPMLGLKDFWQMDDWIARKFNEKVGCLEQVQYYVNYTEENFGPDMLETYEADDDYRHDEFMLYYTEWYSKGVVLG